MLKKIAGVYINPAEIAAIDVHMFDKENDEGETEVFAQPVLVLKCGYQIATPMVEHIEAIEGALDVVMREIEVGH
tara:strand:+ start:74254 stop:74478 length:225 start_codon:yes stop_codon:yes gene_type:complete